MFSYQPPEEIRMRNLLMSSLLAFGVGLTGIIGASAMIGPGSMNKAATNSSPRVWPATEQCRAKTVCDDHGQNCQVVDDCR
jgi:hypothetical protein